MIQSQYVSNCTANALLGAAENILAGNLVAFPTETVYGLGADACNADAVARIYSVKGRPSDHPLIVHVSSMQRMDDWAKEIPVYAILLARDFWPGPMTLVLRRSALAEDFITGGQDTVGIRVPNHVVALALLESFERIGGKGIAAPSANRFGQVSPTTATAAAEEIGEFLNFADQIIDGGACTVGVESTIIDCTGDAPRILRPGAITIDMIKASTGTSITSYEISRHQLNHDREDLLLVSEENVMTDSYETSSGIRVSGSLENHYAPAAKVILDLTPVAGQGLLALANVETPVGVIRLAAPKSDSEFAQILYAALRRADADGLSEVVVHRPTGDGIAVAIRDRLARAANGR